MKVTKSIIVKAIKTENNELIPIWDPRIMCEESELYGFIVWLKDDIRSYRLSVIDCIFDLETKKLSFSEEVEVYPADTEYEIGQTVYYKRSFNELEETKVLNIIYEEFEIEIIKGSEINKWTIKELKHIEVHKELTYSIKRWIPCYVLENGKKTKWGHQLYKKYTKC